MRITANIREACAHTNVAADRTQHINNAPDVPQRRAYPQTRTQHATAAAAASAVGWTRFAVLGKKAKGKFDLDFRTAHRTNPTNAEQLCVAIL